MNKVFSSLSPKTMDSVDVSLYDANPTDVEFLLTAASDARSNWTHKVVACRFLERWAPELRDALPKIIPVVCDLVHDSKLLVGEQAMKTLAALYATIGNRDIEPFVDVLLLAIKEPERVRDAIHALSGIIFVQEVQANLLSVLVPLLLRGFLIPVTAVRRKCCVIIENMCKLIDNGADILCFLPQLIPPISRVMNEVADPECRSVAERVFQLLNTMVQNTEKKRCAGGTDEDDADAPVLCDCEFSLAYGAKILLNRTKMKLIKGGRYGICGANGCGKSTLMKAIVNDQVDGFPKSDVLKRIYVEHDIDGSQAETPVLEFIRACNLACMEAESLQALHAVGFTDERLTTPVGSLSGGWKMKLALARAMMQHPDILLLDEPTNHLDTTNVAWLVDYLNHLTDTTCLIVSHDSGFLDAVCTHIIHYDTLKLYTYKGNLAAFVEKNPQARSYYELGATPVKFKLAEPGFLDGVKTKDKSILKMNGVSFSYTGAEPFIVNDASVYVSLSSRVGCIGANGAGKSTLIKMLTGEIEPTRGTVWKHPNLRIAYVAQNAFHHIEQHLNMTANEYIRWRYATGEDRESENKVTRKITDEERVKIEAKLVHNGVKRQFEKIVGRKKLRKTYEYEVKWMNDEITTYLERDELISLGFEKYVNEFDMKEAAALGLMLKPLTQANVEKHLADLGLDAEVATHNRILGYSGGQKVRLVIGAATWMNPHIIVLDEPSNYLDRDSLGALSESLKEYGGGVIIISHSKEFVDSICSETWTVANGKVEVVGGAPKDKEKQTTLVVDDVVTDMFGNTIKVKAPKKELSNKERKARDKARKARRERGEEVTDSEDEGY